MFLPALLRDAGGLAQVVVGGLLQLVGGGFLCVVQLALAYAREQAPQHTRYMAGLLTTGYAVGQLVGPVLSSLSTALLHRLEPALWIAGLGLAAAGLLIWRRSS